MSEAGPSSPGPWDGPPRPPRRPPRYPGLWLWLGFLAAVGLGLWALHSYFPVQLTQMDAMNMVELMGVLALVSSGLLYARTAPLKPAVRIAALWLAVGAVLLLGFAFRGPLLSLGQTLRSALIPGYPVQTAAGEMMITESTDGAYLVIGRVNGTPVHFMVDTGASDIVLSPADARRLGIALDTLVFAHVYETANGQGRGAPYRVATLQVGGIVLHDVPVSINQAPMQTSLLGMTFLRRLKSFAIADHKMVLRW